ncbi:cyclic pyranopterin phosphate synthase [Acetitomaculum ruminis DSM 5522]|uniref:GTP 3',8-cyclase n=1 Tax=Acetitomaculum ruminis DSM 5522 TaxID=1120918 RepID=A0A1I0UYH8_9FIRM|nr:GTP 3',8-cyclase MoaA [Acetitomaculum ruminis]SFA69149.1 cyclic pyranopterin phosphate synthase [Acetitomaculum ruminis DSM 5522]
MLDSYNRNIDYLRISVTDRCNLRCMYCMPSEGVEFLNHNEILNYDEIIKVCQAAVKLGFKKIKITGGEPLVRKDVLGLIKDIKSLEGIENITITTNGVLLAENMEGLYKAGIDSINVSLDTLNRELYKQITRRDELENVKKGLLEALKYPSVALKVNCVPMGLEGQSLTDVAALAKEYPIHVRFIEIMPIGWGKNYRFLSEEEIKDLIVKEFGLDEMVLYKEKLGNGPCRYYKADGFKGKIGFISAISHKFCGDCNRVRLTSTGFLKTCLQYDTGMDLKAVLRNGFGDEEMLLETIKEAIYKKPDGHRFLTTDIKDENILGMSQIGG